MTSPTAIALKTDHAAAVRGVLTRHAGEPGALLPILHDAQHALGHIPADQVPTIADALNLSRAEVLGVIAHHHHVRSAPAARHAVHVCRAEACRAMGADALMASAELRLGYAAPGRTGDASSSSMSNDGTFTLEPVFCLGRCAASPTLMLDGELHARMTPHAFDELISNVAASSASTT